MVRSQHNMEKASSQEVVSNREAGEMPEKAESKNNYDRLLTYLENGSLAYRLVQAHLDRDIANPAESIKAVLRERLEQVRRSIDDLKA